MGTQGQGSEDTRSRLERVHARWLAPLFGIVGAIAAVIGIIVGLKSCTNDTPTETAQPTAAPASAGRVYEGSKVGRGSGPERPTFTGDRTSPVGVLNSITDNPGYGDERNYTVCKLANQPNSTYSNTVSANDGDVVRVYVFLDNASTRTTAAIVNTRMQLVLDPRPVDDPGVQVVFDGTRQSDGALQRVWDGCGVNSSQPMRLVLAPGSGRVVAGTRDDTKSFSVDDAVITGEAEIPAVPGHSEAGVVPGSKVAWGYFTFDLLAVT